MKLSLQNIEGAEVLTREQLKTVIGGSGGSGEGGTECQSDADCDTITRDCSGGGTQTAIGRCYAHAGTTTKTCKYAYGPCTGYDE